MRVETYDRGARQQLAQPPALRRVRKVRHGRRHLTRRAVREARRLDLPAQRRGRDARVGRGQARIAHSFSAAGSAASSARAPMPTPPLGRAGAAVGFQP